MAKSLGVEIKATITAISFFKNYFSGLEDQLLALVVAEERPDLEEAKNQLIVSNAKMKQELKEIEDKILHKLSASEGSPVDDIDLIHTLEQSKAKSMEIKVTCALTATKWFRIDADDRAPVAQLVEHRAAMRKVVSSTPAVTTIRVLK